MNVRLGDRSWRLTVYEDEVGILRVPHRDADEARRALGDEGADPITTSGTIKAAKERAGIGS
jgi:RNase P/RNase MRP subunit POP5